MKVPNTEANLRQLLTSIYVGVIGHLSPEDPSAPIHPIPDAAWDALATTVLDAAEGREFEPLELPWPPEGKPV